MMVAHVEIMDRRYASLWGLVVWASRPLGRQFFGIGDRDGLGGSMWRHREACVKVKQSHEELMAVRCIDLELDHFAPGLSGSTNMSMDMLGL
jgi:hypothetical protein